MNLSEMNKEQKQVLALALMGGGHYSVDGKRTAARRKHRAGTSEAHGSLMAPAASRAEAPTPEAPESVDVQPEKPPEDGSAA